LPGSNPIVVFATGGSGTRAVAAFLSACGIGMGNRVNNPGDAISFTPVVNTYANRVIETTRSLDYEAEKLDPELCRAAVEDYRQAADRHRQGYASDAPWGFKHPRNIFLLPILDVAFPDAVFVHVVRDGRDMLLARNRNQLEMHFETCFGRPFLRSQEDIAQFWAKTNTEARDFGMRRLKSRYVVVRIEDLCGPERARHAISLAGAVGIDRATASAHLTEFETQESFGRGRDIAFEGDGAIAFNAALATFGYVGIADTRPVPASSQNLSNLPARLSRMISRVVGKLGIVPHVAPGKGNDLLSRRT
jgi:hypothetical protein